MHIYTIRLSPTFYFISFTSMCNNFSLSTGVGGSEKSLFLR